VQSPDVRERLVKLGADPLSMPLAEFEAMIQQELVENAALIKAAGIKAN
jgi:tripartite-type tricarboxylate transporter receptor subunit TctC